MHPHTASSSLTPLSLSKPMLFYSILMEIFMFISLAIRHFQMIINFIIVLAITMAVITMHYYSICFLFVSLDSLCSHSIFTYTLQ
jgi:hypothetical protein